MSTITAQMQYGREHTLANEIAVLVVQAVAKEMGWAGAQDAEATLHKELFDKDAGLWRRAYDVYAAEEGVCAFVSLERTPESRRWESGKLAWLHTRDKGIVSADFVILDEEVSIALPHYIHVLKTLPYLKN